MLLLMSFGQISTIVDRPICPVVERPDTGTVQLVCPAVDRPDTGLVHRADLGTVQRPDAAKGGLSP